MTLTATLSDTEPKNDSNNEDDGILNVFTTTVNPTKGIVEDMDKEEELEMSKMTSTQPMQNYIRS